MRNKNICHICFGVIALFVSFLQTASLCAQNVQTGLVKTKGRINSEGIITKGTPIQGASISLRGSNSVISSPDGSFSLRLANNVFFIESISKNGYSLIDADILHKQFSYSRNPLIIVMETPSRQTEDLLVIERRIRRSLQLQLQEKEEELEALRASNRLSIDEYYAKMQKLYSDAENNESLIHQMAKRYATIDFDQLDAFNASISAYIINGELTKADSLLNSKGDIASRVQSLARLQEANLYYKQELEKSESMAAVQLNDIAQDCYSKYDIFQLRHQMDSARFYIELRASLDSTNIFWQSSASKFLLDLGYFREALEYDLRALNNAKAKFGNSSLEVAECMNNIGSDYLSLDSLDLSSQMFERSLKIINDTGNNTSLLAAKIYIGLGKLAWDKDFSKGEEYIELASNILSNLYGEDSLELEYTYRLLGSLLGKSGKNKEAISLYQKASSIIIENRGDMHPSLATVYQGIGHQFMAVGDYSSALQEFSKAELIYQTVFGDSSLGLAGCYNDIGEAYCFMGASDSSLVYHFKALQMQKNYLGDNSSTIAYTLEDIGKAYYVKEEYVSAIDYYLKSLHIHEALQGGGITFSTAVLHNNIGAAYGELEMLDEALSHYKESLEFFLGLFGEDNAKVAQCYNNIGTIYGRKQMIDEELVYYQKAYDVNVKLFGEKHPSIALCFNNFGTAYYDSGDYKRAKEYFEKAKNTLLLFVPKEHPYIAVFDDNIAACENKLETN